MLEIGFLIIWYGQIVGDLAFALSKLTKRANNSLSKRQNQFW